MILIYAFSNRWGTNISRLTLLELQKLLSPTIQQNIKWGLINYHPRDFFRKYIEHQSYSIIIGLGDYYGPSSQIHIETQAKNAYNDQSIYPFSPIFLDLNLPNVDNYDSTVFKISSQMGTYNCNWLAYSTQLYLNQKNQKTFHLFLHLPQKANAALLSQNIFNLMVDNQII